MFKKLMFLLLLLNLGAVSCIGYNLHKQIKLNEEHKKNVYESMAMLMAGERQLFANQQSLSISILRIHHFADGHNDFYPMCPECQKENPQAVPSELPITQSKSKEQNKEI